MYLLQSDNRSNSSGEPRSENGYLENTATSKQFYKTIIAKANSVPIKSIFKLYVNYVNEYTDKLICPFPFHKGGKENTPSLKIYPETNSFWCFGCKTGRHGVELVSNMEKISRVKAAFKILEKFNDEANLDELPLEGINYSERLEILSDFSLFVKKFINCHTDNVALEFIEKITFSFDKMNSKYNLDNQALKILIEKLKNKTSSYFNL